MKKDLIALRDAVKAKKEFEWEFAAKVIGIRPDNRHVHFMKAKNGSVDAALAFLAAVLPGKHWSLYDDNGVGFSEAQIENEDWQGEPISGRSGTPARALLLATLNAMIGETDK